MIKLASALMIAEAIKLRRTLALWLVVMVPLFADIVATMQFFKSQVSPYSWDYFLKTGFSFWLMIFMPMLILFEAALLANLEHDGNQWKQLFVYPIPRWAVYAAKMLFCALLVGLGLLAFTCGLLLDVMIFKNVRGIHLEASIPWFAILQIIARAFVSSWMIVAIQTWLSIRLSGLVKPVGIGFAALLVGLMLFEIRGLLQELIRSGYPWTLPFSTLLSITVLPGTNAFQSEVPTLSGFAGGISLGLLACWDLGRRCEGE